jgi:hypothetical protein
MCGLSPDLSATRSSLDEALASVGGDLNQLRLYPIYFGMGCKEWVFGDCESGFVQMIAPKAWCQLAAPSVGLAMPADRYCETSFSTVALMRVRRMLFCSTRCLPFGGCKLETIKFLVDGVDKILTCVM